MQKITPHLWFDREAAEAAAVYTSAFRQSAIKKRVTVHGTPSGSVEVLTIELAGQEFSLISAGPVFKFTPAISFFVACTTPQEVDSIWQVLSRDGSALMELGAYPFSERYGWLQDRYGLSWQVGVFGVRSSEPVITPTLMFVGDVCGKAEEAMNFYVKVFDSSRVGDITRYGPGEAPDSAGTVKHASFTLQGQAFAAMDSAYAHQFTFNEAISFIVNCESQREIDYYWDRMSVVPEAEQCGWLKDRYGVSWQIVPVVLDRMLTDKDAAKVARVTGAFLEMKKLDIAELERAFRG